MRSDGGSPALAVPQYWHRAAGFDDTFIAQTESKHRVKFICEHVAAAATAGHANTANAKNMMLCFISLLTNSISKKIFTGKQKKAYKK